MLKSQIIFHFTLGFVLALSSCRRLPERMEIKVTREVSTLAPAPKPNATSDDRFPMPQQQTAPMSGLQDMLASDTPEGWKELPGSAMRLIDRRFGPADEGECYVSFMSGDGGGLDANLNRWRTQMGLAPFTAEEIGKLEKRPFVGRDAVLAAFDGDFKGVGAAEAKKGYRLVGIIHQAPQVTIFVKMIGPKALVEANMPAFDKFCASIRPNAQLQQ